MPTLEAVEAAIVELEKEGKPINAQRVLMRVGGRRNDVQRLFKQAHKPAPRISPLQAQLQEARALQQALQRSLAEMQQTDPLTRTIHDVHAALAIERQLADMAPSLERLQADADREQRRVDVAGALPLWDAYRTRARQLDEDFVESLIELFKCFQARRAIHTEQERLLEDTFPKADRDKLSFPDEVTGVRRLLALLPKPIGEGLQFLLLPQTLGAIDLAHILKEDTGTQPLSPSVLAPYVTEEKP